MASPPSKRRRTLARTSSDLGDLSLSPSLPLSPSLSLAPSSRSNSLRLATHSALSPSSSQTSTSFSSSSSSSSPSSISLASTATTSVASTMSDVQLVRIRSAFELIDLDNSGFIDVAELRKAVVALGVRITEEKVREMIEDYDKDQDGYVNFDEFKEMMTARLGMETSKDDIRSAFDLFDRDGGGRITLKNLKEVAHELGERVTDQELRDMIAVATDIPHIGEEEEDEGEKKEGGEGEGDGKANGKKKKNGRENGKEKRGEKEREEENGGKRKKGKGKGKTAGKPQKTFVTWKQFQTLMEHEC